MALLCLTCIYLVVMVLSCHGFTLFKAVTLVAMSKTKPWFSSADGAATEIVLVPKVPWKNIQYMIRKSEERKYYRRFREIKIIIHEASSIEGFNCCAREATSLLLRLSR